MKGQLRELVAKFGWRMPLQRLLSPRATVVLTYHGIPRHSTRGIVNAEVFEQQMHFLKKNFQLISVDELDRGQRRRSEPVRVLLTFDDGFRNNAEVAAPILRKFRIPAVFFVCSGHSGAGRYLWFVYLRALERWWPFNELRFAGQTLDMSREKRAATVAWLRQELLKLRPHPSAMYKAIDQEGPSLEEFVPVPELRNTCAGMTAEDVAALACDPLFTIGIHTVDHPRLPLCEKQELLGQIVGNKIWIETLTRRPCDLIAYPEAEYNAEVVAQAAALGIRHGFVVGPRTVTCPHLQFPRVGIYSDSIDELGFKVRWGQLLNRVPVRARLFSN